MDSPFSALAGELEVLDGVGLIRQLRIDARIAERTREQPPGRADERQPLDILTIPGLLTPQHDRSIRMAVPEDFLEGVLVQGAAVARVCRSRQGLQAAILWQKLLRSGGFGRTHDD